MTPLEGIKELRRQTQAPFAQCQKAWVDSEANLEKALELLQKQGVKLAGKKAGKIASEGVVRSLIQAEGALGVLVELNCETDFVARNEDFLQFADDVAHRAIEEGPETTEALLQLYWARGITLDDRRKELVAKLGENIVVRRFIRYELGDLDNALAPTEV